MLSCLGIAQAADWPRFRGPEGAGIAKDSRLPAEFGPEKNVAWKIETGPGHSSPVVCGNQVYLTSFTDQQLSIHAYDLNTGKALWVSDVERKRKAKHHNLNNAASPTPVCDERGVIAFFSDFGLVARRTDGKPDWELPIASAPNVHGLSSSPLISGGLYVLAVGADAGSEVIAGERATGKEAWRAPMEGVTYATPVIAGGRLVVIPGTDEVVAFDLTTGKRQWWLKGTPYQPKASPVVSADGRFVYFAILSVEERSKQFISSWEKLLEQYDVNGDGKITVEEMRERKGPAGAFPQVDPNGDGVWTHEEQQMILKIAESPHVAGAIATDSVGDQTGKMRWVIRKGVPNVASPILVDEVLFLFKEGGIVTSVAAADGTVLKEGRISASFGALYSSPIAAGERLYVVSQEGKLVVLRASKDWEVIAGADLGEPCFATPAAVGGPAARADGEDALVFPRAAVRPGDARQDQAFQP